MYKRQDIKYAADERAATKTKPTLPSLDATSTRQLVYDLSAAAAADVKEVTTAIQSVGFVFVAARSSAAYLMSRARRSSVFRAVSFEVRSGRARSKGAGLAT